MKLKLCKICKTKYTPTKPLQMVCGGLCAIEYSKIHLPKVKMTEANQKRKENKAKLKELENLSYWKKILQAQINSIARLIDKDCPCISSGRPYRTDDQAGHFYSVGSTPALRFNLLNLWSQSIRDNMHNSGNLLNYREQLVKFDIIDLIEEQRLKYPTLKLSIEEIKEAIIKTKVVKKLLIEQNNDVFNPRSVVKRVELRVEFNRFINIYKS
jgi:hypothetical protein